MPSHNMYFTFAKPSSYSVSERFVKLNLFPLRFLILTSTPEQQRPGPEHGK